MNGRGRSSLNEEVVAFEHAVAQSADPASSLRFSRFENGQSAFN